MSALAPCNRFEEVLPVGGWGDEDFGEKLRHRPLVAVKAVDGSRYPTFLPKCVYIDATTEFLKNLPDKLPQMPPVSLAKSMNHIHLIDEMRQRSGQGGNAVPIIDKPLADFGE